MASSALSLGLGSRIRLCSGRDWYFWIRARTTIGRCESHTNRVLPCSRIGCVRLGPVQLVLPGVRRSCPSTTIAVRLRPRDTGTRTADLADTTLAGAFTLWESSSGSSRADSRPSEIAVGEIESDGEIDTENDGYGHFPVSVVHGRVAPDARARQRAVTHDAQDRRADSRPTDAPDVVRAGAKPPN